MTVSNFSSLVSPIFSLRNISLYKSPELIHNLQVDFWEAMVTFLFFPALILHAWAQDNNWWCIGKKAPFMVIIMSQPSVFLFAAFLVTSRFVSDPDKKSAMFDQSIHSSFYDFNRKIDEAGSLLFNNLWLFSPVDWVMLIRRYSMD